MSECASCGAEIEWVIVAKSGKRMPIDRDPKDDGNVVQVGRNRAGDRLVDVLGAGATSGAGLFDEVDPARYVSHFATCPEADSWRK